MPRDLRPRDFLIVSVDNAIHGIEHGLQDVIKVGLPLWKDLSSACVVAASGGYPGKYEKGKEITIGDTGDCSVYIAGAAEKDGKLVTSGGRVLSAVATASTLGEALSKAYKAMEHISFEGMEYRKDIGRRALEASDGV